MPTRAALVEQIVRLLDVRLLDPLEILLEGDDAVAALRELIRLRAAAWADLMRGPDDGVAAGAVIRLVAMLYPGDRAFDPPLEWWRTPLGRVVALRVGHPGAESVTLATAGAMLGITRQGVHDLVRRGKLPRHPDGGVPSAAVRDRLRRADESDKPTAGKRVEDTKSVVEDSKKAKDGKRGEDSRNIQVGGDDGTDRDGSTDRDNGTDGDEHQGDDDDQ
ncbi:hypothetical protein BG844_29455 [Couchioplanes caeruleus subsp. caeruleus]|uniref:Uncharacterized protein n=1 Tax=Couchioplanes caeruleus subsp. caeruleus TaxID=56427 RepID=A0A1K0FDT9_9ACTN|nr:hypothetical protein BG844_29455 [Couchioplanes caeruleus subsp. caeruleus]